MEINKGYEQNFHLFEKYLQSLRYFAKFFKIEVFLVVNNLIIILLIIPWNLQIILFTTGINYLTDYIFISPILFTIGTILLGFLFFYSIYLGIKNLKVVNKVLDNSLLKKFYNYIFIWNILIIVYNFLINLIILFYNIFTTALLIDLNLIINYLYFAVSICSILIIITSLGWSKLSAFNQSLNMPKKINFHMEAGEGSFIILSIGLIFISIMCFFPSVIYWLSDILANLIYGTFQSILLISLSFYKTMFVNIILIVFIYFIYIIGLTGISSIKDIARFIIPINLSLY
ncbi:MAG: hypothetical protein ACTSRP_22250 [Candidatus Helarchaeota archaeon]